MVVAEEQLGMLPDDSGDGDSGRYADVPRHKWPKNLVEMIEVAEARFKRHGMDDAAAFRWAREVAVALARHFGGRPFYLPTGDALESVLKHEEIYRRANRDNIEALAAEYGLTVSQIYRIVRQQQKLHIKRTQRELPFKGEGR